MNDSPFSADDPKLTAYALGEIDEHDRAEVEAALAANPALRASVEEIRATVAQLTAALATEALPEMTSGRAANGKTELKSGRGKLIRWPQSYYVIGSLAAAAFALLVYRNQPQLHEAPAKKKVFELTLPAAPATELKQAANEAAGGSAVIVLPEAADDKRGQSANAVVAGTALAKDDLAVTEKAVAQDKEEATKVASSLAPLASGALAAASRVVTPSAPPPMTSDPAKVLFDSSVAANGGAIGLAPSQSATAPSGATEGGGLVQLEAFTVNSAKEASSVGASGMRFYGASRALRFSPPTRDGAPSPYGRRNQPSTETYGERTDNDFIAVANEPLSTFSIDVDTAGYSNLRRFLQSRQLPPRDAVRIEELVNYFPYRYAPPTDDKPFAASLEVASAPWNPAHRLVRIGLKGREVSQAARPAANLVFLLDVSGSMSAPNRLPLVKESMRLLVGRLRADDRVAIVTYAGQSGLALPSTPVSRSREILAALDELSPGGSTNGAMGIQLAYDIAKANFVTAGINRVILCTDGDFNVGVTNPGDLVRLIEEKAKANVFLTVLGFGMGNLKDNTLESLADKGNGNYGYIDTRREAEKLLVSQVNGTLMTIAKDVKIQVEFNPSQVSAYRLIGYENRMLKKEDFNNDKVDAGEIGAGHTVTALYEIISAGTDEAVPSTSVDDLKYQTTGTTSQKADGQEKTPSSRARSQQLARMDGEASRELLTVKIRYKEPAEDVSKRLEFPLIDTKKVFAAASGDFKFAAAVASFGMALRTEPKQLALLTDAARWAADAVGDDPGGYRAEFTELVRQAQALVQ